MSRETIQAGAAERRPISVLLVDDDIELCELLEEFFDQHGFRIESVHDGRRGLARALAGGHDLILLAERTFDPHGPQRGIPFPGRCRARRG